MTSVEVRQDPFPHFVADRYFEPAVFDSAARQWPKVDAGWNQFSCGKRSLNDRTKIPNQLQEIIQHLQSPAFVGSLRLTFGVSDLFPDPSLFGGGLHVVPPGEHLGRHVDFNCIPDPSGGDGVVYRAVNLILYFNQWKPGYGGELVLDREVVVEPTWNRLVCFRYSETAWHGHNRVREKARRSLALYYYTREKPADFIQSHSTIYRD